MGFMSEGVVRLNTQLGDSCEGRSYVEVVHLLGKARHSGKQKERTDVSNLN